MITSGLISAAISAVVGFQANNLSNDDCKKEFSIFTENMKTKSYEYAFPSFRFLINECPEVGTGLYIRGEELLNHYITKSKDEKVKEGMIDTLFLMLDKRIEVAKKDEKYGRVGFILGKKANYMALYQKDKIDQIFELAKRSVELEGSESAASVMSTYMQYTAILNTKGKFSCDDVISVYNVLSEYIDENLKRFEDTDSVKYKNNLKAQENVDQLAGNCLTCENLVDILRRNFDANKDNASWVKRTVDALDRKKCLKEEKYRTEQVILDLFDKNVAFNPSTDGYKKLARMHVLIGNIDKAQANYEKAIDMAAQNDDKAQLYMELALILAEKGQYPQARNSARNAAKLRENWGKPYIFIGDLYAGSAARCVVGNPCEDRAVFWAAVDKYAYAKSIDPSFTDEANRKIGVAAANYPTTDQCFFDSFKEGQSYTVGCWINEATTVRMK